MLIKDLQNGIVREYGKDCHDSLAISADGRALSYYNLQCGDGSMYGDFRFVMEDGEVPCESLTPDAIHGESYFNIGGFSGREEREKEIIALINYFAKSWNKEKHKRIPYFAISELIEFIQQNDTPERVINACKN